MSVFHLAHLNYYGRGGIILTCGFNLLFQMTHEVECHLFMFIDNFCSLSDEVSKSFAYFSIGLPFFFSHGFLRVLYIFQMCILFEEIQVCQYFFKCVFELRFRHFKLWLFKKCGLAETLSLDTSRQ